MGFFLASLGLCVFSACAAVLSLVMSAIFNRRFIGVAKQAAFLLVGFGLLCVLTVFTEKLWF